MTRGQFLWTCFFKQLLWIPGLIAYVLVRATFKVHHGDKSPYRLNRHQVRPLSLLRFGYVLILLATVTLAVYLVQWTLLAVFPAGWWLLGMAVLRCVPQAWFEDYAIKSDIPARYGVALRLTFYTVLAAALAWATLLTGMPWWLFYGLLWLVPLGTSFAFFMVLRQIVQHGNADRERFTNTRVFLVNPLISMAVFPIGNDYHLPHHLFPMVPHYNLRRLHGLLMEKAIYQAEAVVVEGYFIPPQAPPVNPTVLDVMTQ